MYYDAWNAHFCLAKLMTLTSEIGPKPTDKPVISKNPKRVIPYKRFRPCFTSFRVLEPTAFLFGWKFSHISSFRLLSNNQVHSVCLLVFGFQLGTVYYQRFLRLCALHIEKPEPPKTFPFWFWRKAKPWLTIRFVGGLQSSA